MLNHNDQIRTSSKFLHSLGLISYYMSELEIGMWGLLHKMLNRNGKLSRNLMAEQQIDQKLKILTAVFTSTEQDKSTVKEFKKLTKDIHNVHQERNKLIHVNWNFDDVNMRAFRFKLKKSKIDEGKGIVDEIFSSEGDEFDCKLETIENVIKNIQKITRDVYKFGEKYFPVKKSA
jgi:hypothetical protein